MTKRRYTPEFKQQALELAQQAGSIAEASRRLGVSESLLYSWKGKLKVSLDPKKKTVKSAMDEAEEMKRLRKENEELKKTNYILKKAAAFFSQDHLK